MDLLRVFWQPFDPMVQWLFLDPFVSIQFSKHLPQSFKTKPFAKWCRLFGQYGCTLERDAIMVGVAADKAKAKKYHEPSKCVGLDGLRFWVIDDCPCLILFVECGAHSSSHEQEEPHVGKKILSTDAFPTHRELDWFRGFGFGSFVQLCKFDINFTMLFCYSECTSGTQVPVSFYGMYQSICMNPRIIPTNDSHQKSSFLESTDGIQFFAVTFRFQALASVDPIVATYRLIASAYLNEDLVASNCPEAKPPSRTDGWSWNRSRGIGTNRQGSIGPGIVGGDGVVVKLYVDVCSRKGYWR